MEGMMSEDNATLFPYARILSALAINRLRAMGLLIELPAPHDTRIAACAICFNRGHISSAGGSVKPCLCTSLTTHSS